MTKKTLVRASDDYLRLIAYTIDLPNGAVVRYGEVETDTGIKMNTKGRSLLRQAIRHNQRTYRNLLNEGYELDSPENWKPIVSKKLHDFDRHAVRVKETVKIIKTRHYEVLPDNEKQALTYADVVVTRGMLSTEEVKMFYKKETITLSESKPIIH